jgi:quinol monooxygenase YgiN
MTELLAEPIAEPVTESITVTIKLIAKDRDKTLRHLAHALPVTRTYNGCRYCNTFTQADNPQEIILIQGWDSRTAQQQYIQWRQETGALNELLELLTEPPTVEFWHLSAA